MPNFKLYDVSNLAMRSEDEIWASDAENIEPLLRQLGLASPDFPIGKDDTSYTIDLIRRIDDKVAAEEETLEKADLEQVFRDCSNELADGGFDMPPTKLKVLDTEIFNDTLIEKKADVFRRFENVLASGAFEKLMLSLLNQKHSVADVSPCEQAIYVEFGNEPWRPTYARKVMLTQLVDAYVKGVKGEWSPKFFDDAVENALGYFFGVQAPIKYFTEEAVKLNVREQLESWNTRMAPYNMEDRIKLELQYEETALYEKMNMNKDVEFAPPIFAYSAFSALSKRVGWECLASVDYAFPDPPQDFVALGLYMHHPNYEEKNARLRSGLYASGLAVGAREPQAGLANVINL